MSTSKEGAKLTIPAYSLRFIKTRVAIDRMLKEKNLFTATVALPLDTGGLLYKITMAEGRHCEEYRLEEVNKVILLCCVSKVSLMRRAITKCILDSR